MALIVLGCRSYFKMFIGLSEAKLPATLVRSRLHPTRSAASTQNPPPKQTAGDKIDWLTVQVLDRQKKPVTSAAMDEAGLKMSLSVVVDADGTPLYKHESSVFYKPQTALIVFKSVGPFTRLGASSRLVAWQRLSRRCQGACTIVAECVGLPRIKP